MYIYTCVCVCVCVYVGRVKGNQEYNWYTCKASFTESTLFHTISSNLKPKEIVPKGGRVEEEKVMPRWGGFPICELIVYRAGA